MFTREQREQLGNHLVSAAKGDPRISGAAFTGSAASGREDQWSDIDFALCVHDSSSQGEVIADWTNKLYENHQALTHCDVLRGRILYRVFLLENTLQVDISFWPANEFGAIGPTFQLLFGSANTPRPAPQPELKELIGMAWLYALHVRSSIARGRCWQAEYMLNGMRENTLALACVRSGVSALQGRGLDDLPEHIKSSATASLPSSLHSAELKRAFRVTMNVLLSEIRQADPDLANKLESSLNEIVHCVGDTSDIRVSRPPGGEAPAEVQAAAGQSIYGSSHL